MGDKDITVEKKEENYYSNEGNKITDFLIGFFISILVVAIAWFIATLLKLPYGVLIGFAVTVILFIGSIRILRRSKRRMIGVGMIIPASVVMGIGMMLLLVLGACSVMF